MPPDAQLETLMVRYQQGDSDAAGELVTRSSECGRRDRHGNREKYCEGVFSLVGVSECFIRCTAATSYGDALIRRLVAHAPRRAASPLVATPAIIELLEAIQFFSQSAKHADTRRYSPTHAARHFAVLA